MPVELKLLLLILIANGVPLVAALVCGDWGARPLDGGRTLADGHRLLGNSKTWRGAVLAPLVTGVAALPLLLPMGIGVLVGIGAMLGDLLTSFVKRRLGMASSSRALGLDQIPEALLPSLLVAASLELSWAAIGLTVAGFALVVLTLSPVFFRLGLRKQPH
jgi:CDP-2,3-bis-(O-geranylgeranyl)-sn-glycerol synthase